MNTMMRKSFETVQQNPLKSGCYSRFLNRLVRLIWWRHGGTTRERWERGLADQNKTFVKHFGKPSLLPSTHLAKQKCHLQNIGNGWLLVPQMWVSCSNFCRASFPPKMAQKRLTWHYHCAGMKQFNSLASYKDGERKEVRKNKVHLKRWVRSFSFFSYFGTLQVEWQSIYIYINMCHMFLMRVLLKLCACTKSGWRNRFVIPHQGFRQVLENALFIRASTT